MRSRQPSCVSAADALSIHCESPVPSKPYTLGALLLLAFGLRAAFFSVHHTPLEFPDSVIYDKIAANVCAGVGLVQDPHTAAFRPPLYPLFLALSYRLFGRNLALVGLLQALMGAATVLVVYRIGREWFDEATGWIAAAIVAIYPFFIFYSALLLTETLFILLLAAIMALLGRAAGVGADGRRGSYRAAALAGILLGLGVLTRSSLVGFLVFLAPIWWLAARARGRGRAAFSWAVMLLCMVAVLTPWAVRNRVRTGHLVFTTLQSGHDLYEANSPEATGGPAADRINWDKLTEAKSLTEYERDQFFRQKALAYIRENPGRFLHLAAIKFCRFWSPIPNYEKYRSSLYNAISLLSFGPVLVLAIIGVVLLHRRWRELLLLLSPVVYYSLLHVIFVGSTRYRTPVEPFLMVVAAYVVRTIIAPWRRDGGLSTP